MEITLAQLIYVIALAVCMAATYTWRKAALTWKQQAKQLEDFIKDPNVAVRDKEAEYKNSIRGHGQRTWTRSAGSSTLP